MHDLVKKEDPEADIMEQLLMGLGDRSFFLSFEVAVSMKLYQIVATIMWRAKVEDWLVEQDED